MDEPTVAERGVQPLLDELAAIDAAETPEALAAVVGVLQRNGVGGGTGVYVDTDSKNSTRYLVHLNQSGLGLPDESYYREAQHAEILAAYPQHIAAMFALVYGGEHAETPHASSRWKPSWRPHIGTSSSVATPTSPTTCARSPTCRPRP
jgi:predicted metalloendopeptidase